MFERIIVGTDGSETAAEAVRQATELARATGAKLDIVSAYQPVSAPACARRAARSRATSPTRWAQGGRQRDPRGRRRPAEEAGVEVETHAREGDPADAILNVAEEVGASVIVVGNKGMTGARRFLLGSVPNKISHHAPCSVYIARTT